MEFDELVGHLRRQLHLPTLAAGPGGSCAIRFDDLVVRFTHAPAERAFDLEAALGRFDLKAAAVQRTLQAGQEGSCTLRWNDVGEVGLHQRFWLQALSFAHFFRALERFLNQADHWRARLRGTR